MKRLALAMAFVAAAALTPAQSLHEYLKLRLQNGIDHAVDVDALQDVTKTKVMEVRGAVKGSFRQGNRITLLLGLGNGGTREIDADFVPEWLMMGDDTPARLLVKAVRPDDASPVHVVLLGAAKAADIEPLDAALEKKRAKANEAAQRRASLKAAQDNNARSRLKRGGLFGPIGRHSSTERSAHQWVLPVSEVTPIYASYIQRVNPRLSNATSLRMAEGIVGYCLHYGVDARLVMAVIIVESGFDPNSVSHSGAMGLGQLMPATARWMGVANPFNDVDNIYGMVKLLHTHLEQYLAQTGGDQGQALQLALAAYNAGEGAVRRHGGVPPYRETQAYVRHVIDLYQQLTQ